MNRVIESIERRQMRSNLPQFKAGDTVRVHFQVIEGQRRRTQVFEGIVMKRQGSGVHETFTVRKQSFGVGVERTFPLHSPKIERIEVAAIGVVRRAKLYYLREKVGKRARVRTKAGAVLPVSALLEVAEAEQDQSAVAASEDGAGVAEDAAGAEDVATEAEAASQEGEALPSDEDGSPADEDGSPADEDAAGHAEAEADAEGDELSAAGEESAPSSERE
jgi:large subunit ribosomal protein L19